MAYNLKIKRSMKLKKHLADEQNSRLADIPFQNFSI